MAQDSLSLRAYAKHRKALGLPGATLKSVQKAIESERISVVVVGGMKRIQDPDAADREWSANTDHLRSPGLEDDEEDGDGDDQADGVGDEFKGASARDRYWKAKRSELVYRREAGELTSAAEAQAGMEEDYSEVRTRILGAATKLKQRLPHLTFTDLAAIDEVLREALETLAADAE